MYYRMNNKVAKDKDTSSVGNGQHKIGSSASDRFAEIWSVVFKGDATGSYYGDLAEHYTCNSDISLSLGTLMEVSNGEFDSEICDTELSYCVIGIISEHPGFEMNMQIENSALIGLIGTVPVRAIGVIKKKDILVSAGAGCVRSAENDFEKKYKVAISLENKDEVGEKLIKCFVK